MAKIVPSKEAPNETFSISLPGKEVTFKTDGSHDSDDRAVLVEAHGHPWLTVEYDESENPVTAFRSDSLSPKDDVLSAENDESFDPKAVERDRADADANVVSAIDAGLDQNKKVYEDGVAKTLAADAADTKKETKN